MPVPELWGRPITVYLGMITLACFLTTMTLGLLIFSGKAKISIKVHRNMALTTLGIALVHGYFAFVTYFLKP